jgi:hypothetical protein
MDEIPHQNSSNRKDPATALPFYQVISVVMIQLTEAINSKLK